METVIDGTDASAQVFLLEGIPRKIDMCTNYTLRVYKPLILLSLFLTSIQTLFKTFPNRY